MNFSDYYRGKRVLVTGHTGFKGSWLTEWLLMMGAKVTGLALAPSTDPALFDQLGLAGRCDHRLGDIRDRALVHKVIHEVRPDVIFHLAAQPLVRLSYAQPIETYETNVMGTAHVLDALRDADWPCAAVMITTDKVYENKEWLHAYRESDPLGGYDPYSSSKACAELVIQSYWQSFFNPAKIISQESGRLPSHASRLTSHSSRLTSHDSRLTSAASRLTSHVSPPLVAVASARAGNVIGGGDWAQDRIVPDCMRALAKGEVIAVRNSHATRPWQHVLEPLSGYLLLGMKLHGALTSCISHLTSDVSHPASCVSHLTSNVSRLTPSVSHLTSYSSSFNFGPALASNRSVGELVDEILKHWPGQWEDQSDPGAPHEAGMLNLAADKAFHLLGWQPQWGFEQTILETVSWYRTVREKGNRCVLNFTREQIASYSGRA